MSDSIVNHLINEVSTIISNWTNKDRLSLINSITHCEKTLDKLFNRPEVDIIRVKKP